MKGRKPTTGRYETRAELEKMVGQYYYETAMKTAQIARVTRISEVTAAQIVDKIGKQRAEREIARRIVEYATIIAGQLRRPMCYVCDKPRAVIEYPRNSPTRVMQEELTERSMQRYYEECRERAQAAGLPAFVGD